MKYCFFDIECSNCYGGIGKICEFGYAIFDKEFQLLEKHNIFINPESSFCVVRRKNKKIQPFLTRNKSYYESCPNFVAFYSQIKSILTQKNMLYFAYDSNNDISFLLTTLYRYNLPGFDFICYDAQKIAAKYLDYKEKQPGLDPMRILLKLDDENMLQHQGSNDAYMTGKVIHQILVNKETSFKEFVKDIKGLKVSFMGEYNKVKLDYEISKIKREISVPSTVSSKDKTYKHKRYYIVKENKKEKETYLHILSKIKDRGLYITRSVSNADKVLYEKKEDIAFLKKIPWWKRRFKFVSLKKFLAK